MMTERHWIQDRTGMTNRRTLEVFPARAGVRNRKYQDRARVTTSVRWPAKNGLERTPNAPWSTAS